MLIKSHKMTLTAVYFGVFAMMSCEMKTQLSEMHDSTQRLEKNTQKMSDTTEKMEKTTGVMAETTERMSGTTLKLYESTMKMLGRTDTLVGASAELYDALKQGDSLNLRRQGLAAMNSAQSSGRKLAEAVKYVLAFEFQLFSGLGQDMTEEKLDRLKEDAMAEFFKDVKEYYILGDKPHPLAQAGGGVEDNKRANFNALAAVLHKENRKQQETAKSTGQIKAVSILTMINETLEKGQLLKAGKISFSQLKHYEKEILNNEEIALQLLQARHNFIKAIVLSETSQISKGKIKALTMMLFKWDLNLSEFNEVQLSTYVSYIDAVHSTENELKKLGQPIYKDSLLMRLLKKARLISSGTKTAAQTQFEQKFNSLVQ